MAPESVPAGNLCGSTIHEVYVGSTCCSQTFTCPSGQQTWAYGYYTVQGWRFCQRI